jgi:hypothetical protein
MLQPQTFPIFSDNITGRICPCTAESFCEDSFMAGAMRDNMRRFASKLFLVMSVTDCLLSELANTGSAQYNVRRLVLMKITRRYEIAFISCGVLLGFNLGVWSYAAFFLPPNTDRNGLAELFASVCLLVGLVWLAVMRAEIRRKDESNQKHDA